MPFSVIGKGSSLYCLSCAFISLAIALFVFFDSTTSVFVGTLFHDHLAQVPLAASGGLLLCSLTILFMRWGSWWGSFSCGIIILAFSTTFLLEWLIAVPINNFSPDLLSYSRKASQTLLVPSSTLAFLLLGLGTILVSLPLKFRKLLMLGSLFGLASFALSGLGLYSYLVLTGIDYGWVPLMRTPPLLAVALFLLTSSIILVGWTRYNAQETRFYELLTTIEIIAGAGITLLAITGSLISLLTWYYSFQDSLQTKLYSILKGKVALVEEYFGRIKDSGNQIASRTVPIEKLEQFIAGTISQEEYRREVAINLRRSMNAAPGLLGVTRVDVQRRSVVSIGLRIPERVRKSRVVESDLHAITFPYQTPRGPVFLVKTPVHDLAGKLVAADFLVVPLTQLYRPFFDEELLGKTGRIFVGAYRGRRLSIIELKPSVPSDLRIHRGDRDEIQRARFAMRRAARNRSGTISLNIGQNHEPRMAFFMPIPAADWGVVLSMKSQEFWGRIGPKFVEVVAATSILVLVATVFFSLLIRTFFRQVFRLEAQRSQAQVQLEAELQRRELAERVSRGKGIELEAIVENAVHGILTLDPKGTILSINRAATEMFGFSVEEVIGKNLQMLLPVSDEINAQIGNALKIENNSSAYQHNRWELKGFKKDGSEFPLEFSIGVVSTGEREFGTAGIYDLTERVQSRKRLEESLKEKEMLLKEVHHRVKNNLQVVSSIFSLQRRRTRDSVVSTLLEESQGRIQSIALLHETLYRSQNLSRIDMGDYLRQLVHHHTSSLTSRGSFVGKVEATGVFLDIDKAIPCGLIVNELLTNSIKHGYPVQLARDHKELEVTLSRTEADTVTMRYRDNGAGMPTEIVDNESPSSLGLRLIKTLCQQLSGTMKVEVRDGTLFLFEFP